VLTRALEVFCQPAMHLGYAILQQRQVPVVVEEPGLGVLLRLNVFGPIVGLAILALIPVAYKRWRGNRVA